MLVFQNLPSRHTLAEARRQPRLRFFSSAEWFRIGLVGAIATAVILGGFIFNLGADLDVAHARSMAIAALVIASAAMTAALTRLGTRAAVLATVLPVASAFVAIQIEPVATLLHLSPLHGIDWILAASGGALISASAVVLRQGESEKAP